MKCPFFSYWKMFFIIIFPAQLFIFIYLHVILTLWHQLENSWHCNHRTSLVKIHNMEFTFCFVYKDTVCIHISKDCKEYSSLNYIMERLEIYLVPCRRRKGCGFNPWVGMGPGGNNGNPLLYFYLENLMDRGGWQAIVYEVAKNHTWLSSWEHTPFSSVPFGIQSFLIPFFFLVTDSEVNTDFMTRRKLAQIYVLKLFSSSSFSIL